jgi:ubiquinone/menaquinone biosynthesis C-methylase UbiE
MTSSVVVVRGGTRSEGRLHTRLGSLGTPDREGSRALSASTHGGVAGEILQPSEGSSSADHGPVDPNAIYALGHSSAESARLQRQADELAPDSADLLDGVGLRAGDSAIDLGCGPRGVIELLAERVSPGGRVVGLDGDPAHVAMASELVVDRALAGVELICADARHSGLEPGSFDLAHARTLLVTLPDPGEVLAEMVRLVRPGGWVAGMEPDTGVAICYPPHPAFDRLCQIFTIAFSRNGADPHIGRRMAELYRHAGLTEITVEARAGVYPVGHSRRTIRADLVRSMRPQILELRLADERELDDIDAAVRKHFDDPDTVVMAHLMFLARGRKPVHA